MALCSCVLDCLRKCERERASKGTQTQSQGHVALAPIQHCFEQQATARTSSVDITLACKTGNVTKNML